MIVQLVAYMSLGALAVVNAALTQQDVGVAISIVPVINLVAIIGAAVTVGMTFQRVRDLERRVEQLEQGQQHGD